MDTFENQTKTALNNGDFIVKMAFKACWAIGEIFCRFHTNLLSSIHLNNAIILQEKQMQGQIILSVKSEGPL